MDDAPRWFTGQLLLALPAMEDARFARSASLMIAHDEGGAMALGLSETIPGLSVGEVFDQLDIAHDGGFDMAVRRGGPVEPSRGFVIHSDDWGGQDVIDVAGRWRVSSSHDVLRAIAGGTGPARWTIVLGYAGWSPGQLEAEMTTHSWHLVAASDALLFDSAPEDCWRAAWATSGIDAALLTAQGGRA